MKLWRLTQKEHLALDGKGALQFGGRYFSPGQPIISFASEAGLAVLVALRYLQSGDADMDYMLGWTLVNAVPERVPDSLDDQAKKDFVDEWAGQARSLLIAVQSAVLPEADVIPMNARHHAAQAVVCVPQRYPIDQECGSRP